MTLYMPELERKKRVKRFNPDTTRVLSHYNREEEIPTTLYTSTHTGDKHPSPVQSRPRSAGRHHKPHPTKVDFLIQDCHLLHEPICEVRDNKQRKPRINCASHKEQNASHWWPTKVPEGAPKVPKYCENTTNRKDFIYSSKSSGAKRHSSNPNSHASTGIVPVTHLPDKRGPRLLVEHISYQHQYDCRQNPTQPTRGKLHGSFVWDVLNPVSQAANSNTQLTSHSATDHSAKCSNMAVKNNNSSSVASILTPAEV